MQAVLPEPSKGEQRGCQGGKMDWEMLWMRNEEDGLKAWMDEWASKKMKSGWKRNK